MARCVCGTAPAGRLTSQPWPVQAPRPSEADPGWLAEQATEARREREAEANEAAAWSNAASGPAIDEPGTRQLDAATSRRLAGDDLPLSPPPPEPAEPPPRAPASPAQADPAAIAARAAELLAQASATRGVVITEEDKARDYYRAQAATEHRCFVCDGPARFGYGPPGWSQPLWTCRVHRDAVEQLRADPAAPHGAERPPAWTEVADTPRTGDRCNACRGNAWWTESAAPRGWRCRSCHPPAHAMVRLVRT
jgi:hypothetical protein